ncbi:hypothetical protein ACJW30_09G084700 [Castanea mollissima]
MKDISHEMWHVGSFLLDMSCHVLCSNILWWLQTKSGGTENTMKEQARQQPYLARRSAQYLLLCVCGSNDGSPSWLRNFERKR